MKDFKIETVYDVAKFFMYLVFERSVNIDPNDDIHDYIDRNGNPSFTTEEADEIQSLIDKSWEICKKENRCIQKIALIVLGLYDYCDHNDVMAKFCLNIMQY